MRRTTRLGAYVASAALAFTGSLSGAALAPALADAPIHDLIGVDQGAAWLQGQLNAEGLMYNKQYDFVDYGLSIDAALALDAVGGHVADVQKTSDGLAANINAYITGGQWGPDDIYSGSVAKAAVLAGVAGDDPTSFGGVDLIQTLEARVATAAPIAGRLEDKGSADYANVLGQALAARALDKQGSARADEVTDFLLQQQCGSGYFRLNFTKDKAAQDQACVEGTDSPDTDATAFTLIQLADQSADPAVTSAVTRARAWLVDQQKADGSWGGGTATEGSNANSTGLSAAALGDTAASEQAAKWLRAHQADSTDVCTALEADQGAIAYDDAGLAAGRSGGIDEASSDQWRRASAQAVPGLAYLPVDTTPASPALEGPSGFRKAGSRTSFTTSGLNDGDVLCLSGRGVRQRQAVTGTSWTVPVTLPGGTATRVYTVRDADGHSDTAAVKVLGRKKLPVHRSKSRVRRSGRVSVVVRGLEPGEQAKVYYKGRIKKRGTANSAGKVRTSFRVGRATGRKRIVAVGQFSDIRRGTTVVRVRR